MSKVGFVSLGCPKALVDSERILTRLREEGYEISTSYNDASVVIVNTCGFIDSAKAESIEAIGEAMEENGRVIVTGCLGTHADEIRRIHPGVLSVSGPQQYEEVVRAVLDHAPPAAHNPFVDLLPPQGIRLTPRHYAYLKISEGCNHHCSFCIIPSMRGRLVSRDIDDVMDEAERLVAAGVRELLVISQDTGAYGVDIRYRARPWRGSERPADLRHLAEALAELGVWIRLHYVYPYPHVDDLIPMMAEGRILPYLDIPFQHGSPRILKLMRRPAAAEDTLARIQRWRESCPDLTLRSTFIVGFPGETEEDFDTLLEFLREANLDRVGCFRYSPVEGAAANDLSGHVPEALKDERWERFMAVQQEISRNRLQRRVGTTIQVLVDEVHEGEALARSHADAPEIDGLVSIALPTGHNVKTGDLLDVRIIAADDYDLRASLD